MINSPAINIDVYTFLSLLNLIQVWSILELYADFIDNSLEELFDTWNKLFFIWKRELSKLNLKSRPLFALKSDFHLIKRYY